MSVSIGVSFTNVFVAKVLIGNFTLEAHLGYQLSCFKVGGRIAHLRVFDRLDLGPVNRNLKVLDHLDCFIVLVSHDEIEL